MYRAVVLRDEYDFVVRGDLGVWLWVQPDPAIPLAESDHRATLVGREGFTEGHACETGLADKVDLIPPEVQEVRVDEGEA
jgi:hypothetical protein